MKISKAMIELMQPYVDAAWAAAEIGVKISSTVTPSPDQEKARIIRRMVNYYPQELLVACGKIDLREVRNGKTIQA